MNENRDIIRNIEEKKLPNIQDENSGKLNPPPQEQIFPPNDDDAQGQPKPDAQLEVPAGKADRKVSISLSNICHKNRINQSYSSVQIIPAPPVDPVHFPGPTTSRQHAVVAACKHAWRAYRKVAWGHDQLKPISKTFHDWFGLGLSIVDGLDTLYIMNLQKGEQNISNQDVKLKTCILEDNLLFQSSSKVENGWKTVYVMMETRR